ncbi:MAG: hypothetical protein AWU59_2636 [Methanolobus sp. T82-4]|jgi:hypothetical protein|nr:MAG: hypothetical protein AWU59_2636 [Methanolobus sp. T82-4]
MHDMANVNLFIIIRFILNSTYLSHNANNGNKYSINLREYA